MINYYITDVGLTMRCMQVGANKMKKNKIPLCWNNSRTQQKNLGTMLEQFQIPIEKPWNHVGTIPEPYTKTLEPWNNSRTQQKNLGTMLEQFKNPIEKPWNHVGTIQEPNRKTLEPQAYMQIQYAVKSNSFFIFESICEKSYKMIINTHFHTILQYRISVGQISFTFETLILYSLHQISSIVDRLPQIQNSEIFFTMPQRRRHSNCSIYEHKTWRNVSSFDWTMVQFFERTILYFSVNWFIF